MVDAWEYITSKLSFKAFKDAVTMSHFFKCLAVSFYTSFIDKDSLGRSVFFWLSVVVMCAGTVVVSYLFTHAYIAPFWKSFNLGEDANSIAYALSAVLVWLSIIMVMNFIRMTIAFCRVPENEWSYFSKYGNRPPS